MLVCKNVFTCSVETEASDLKLRNDRRYVIKICNRLGKTAPETVDLKKEAYKDECFGESMIFR